jgi:Proteasome subunit
VQNGAELAEPAPFTFILTFPPFSTHNPSFNAVHSSVQWWCCHRHGWQELRGDLQVRGDHRDPLSFKPFSTRNLPLFFLPSDMRLGANFQTVACDFEKVRAPRMTPTCLVEQVFRVSDKLYIGLTGLATDVLTLEALLKFRCNMYKLRENREMKPETFSALVRGARCNRVAHLLP